MFSLLLVLGTSIAAGLVPTLFKLLVDSLAQKNTPVYDSVPYLIAVYAGTHWFIKSMAEARGMFYARFDQRLQRQLSDNVFEHILSLPLRFHLNRTTGSLTQTVNNGLSGYRILMQHIFLTALPSLLELGTIGAVLLVLDQAVFVVIVTTAAVLYGFAFRVGVARITGPARDASNANICANGVLTDSILNYETVKHFAAESRMRTRYVEALTRTEDAWTVVFRRKLENGLVVGAIFAFSIGLSLFVAGVYVREGRMTIGEFVLVNAYVFQITRPVETIGVAVRGIAEGLALLERMTELLKEEKEPDAVGRFICHSEDSPRLAFEHVSYSYRQSPNILEDINLAVSAGATIAVVGASGSGKTSFIRLLTRLIEPTKGDIRLNGMPLSSIPRSFLRQTISIVPQDITLFNESIGYNIGLGKPDSTENEIAQAAKIAQIHDFIVALPDGYSTQVGERGLLLSGGEKQRIAIARAVIRNPKILIFDEATSSLDYNTEAAILHSLLEIAQPATTIIIAHRLSTVACADEIVVLDHGRIIERGTHSDLLGRRKTYAKMWQAQDRIGQDLICR